MALAIATPMAHMHRRAINQTHFFLQSAHAPEDLMAQTIEQPAQVSGPSVELALVEQARKQSQVVVLDEAQEGRFFLEAAPVLSDHQGQDFAVGELRFASELASKPSGGMLLVEFIDNAV